MRASKTMKITPKPQCSVHRVSYFKSDVRMISDDLSVLAVHMYPVHHWPLSTVVIACCKHAPFDGASFNQIKQFWKRGCGYVIIITITR